MKPLTAVLAMSLIGLSSAATLSVTQAVAKTQPSLSGGQQGDRKGATKLEAKDETEAAPATPNSAKIADPAPGAGEATTLSGTLEISPKSVTSTASGGGSRLN